MSAGTSGHTEHWQKYSAADTERDLDFAKRLQLNQMRVLIPWQPWSQDREAFLKNLQHLVRAAHERGIGVMPTLMYPQGLPANKERWPEMKPWVADMVAAIGKEPGLAFWDAANEPECCTLPPSDAVKLRMEHAMYMAKLFHDLDPVTPVTIGATFTDNMIAMNDAVDVLVPQLPADARGDRGRYRQEAKAFAAKVNLGR